MKTNKFKLVFTVYCLLITICSYSQNWQWAKKAGSSAPDYYSQVISDNNNNLYVGGYTSSYPTLYFGSTTISYGPWGPCIAKYDESGNEVWIKVIKQSNATEMGTVNRLLYDSLNDAVVVLGSFQGTLSIQGLSIGSSERDAFIAKFDNNGNCQWLNLINTGVTYGQKGVCFAGDIDSYGNIYLCPSIKNPYGLYGSDTIQAGGNIIKLDLNGNLIWVNRQINVTISKFIPNILKIIDNKLFIIGDAGSSFYIDTIYINDSTGDGALVACFNMDANVMWAKKYGIPSGSHLVAGHDSSGNIYSTGDFSQIVCFENDTLVNNTSFPYAWTALIFKTDKDGNYKWSRKIGSSDGSSFLWGISTSPDGTSYITGKFRNTITMGNFSLTSVGSDYNMFFASIDSSGNFIGASTTGCISEGLGVTILSDGSPIICGKFKNTATFGTNSLTSYGDYDMYIARCDAITNISKQMTVSGKDSKLIIYANPTTGKCNIEIPDEFLNEKGLVLSIYDSKGSLIQQKPLVFVEDKIKLDIESEAKGIYNVVLTNGKKSYGGRIVFE